MAHMRGAARCRRANHRILALNTTARARLRTHAHNHAHNHARTRAHTHTITAAAATHCVRALVRVLRARTHTHFWGGSLVNDILDAASLRNDALRLVRARAREHAHARKHAHARASARAH